MHVENIKSTQTVYKNRIVTNEYTTVIDDRTHKRYTEVTTHELMLYDRKGTNLHWTNKHNINEYI
jgi:hypothetical protein